MQSIKDSDFTVKFMSSTHGALRSIVEVLRGESRITEAITTALQSLDKRLSDVEREVAAIKRGTLT